MCFTPLKIFSLPVPSRTFGQVPDLSVPEVKNPQPSGPARRAGALDVSNRIWAMHKIGWDLTNLWNGPKSWQGFKTHFQQQESNFLWWWRWSRWWCWCWGWRWLLGLKIKLLTKHFWRHVWLRTYVDQAKVLDLLETMSHGPIRAYHVYQKPH